MRPPRAAAGRGCVATPSRSFAPIGRDADRRRYAVVESSSNRGNVIRPRHRTGARRRSTVAYRSATDDDGRRTVDLSAVRRRIYPAGGPPPLRRCWRRRQAAASPGTASRICDDPRIWPDPPTRSQSLGFSRANPLVVQCKSQKCANGMQHAPSRTNSFTGLAATGSPSRRTRIQTRPGLKSGPPGVMGS